MRGSVAAGQRVSASSVSVRVASPENPREGSSTLRESSVSQSSFESVV